MHAACSAVTIWRQALQHFDFAIDLIASKESLIADSLSRIWSALILQNSDASDEFLEVLDAASDSASEPPSENSLALVGLDTIKQHLSKESNITKQQKWLATQSQPTGDDLQGWSAVATSFTISQREVNLSTQDRLWLHSS